MAARVTISTTKLSWFLRGFLGGILLAGALNAASFFYRSEQGGNLLGVARHRREALGFPQEMWEQGNNYGGYFVDYPALLVNMACGALIGAAGGMFTLWNRRRLNQLVAQFEALAEPQPRTFQISLRGLMLVTTIVATVLAIATRFNVARPGVLGAIYLLGPWVLIAIAFVPRGIAWQQRAAILIPSVMLTMLAAIYVGNSLRRSVEFDRVLLGIFICWTPQTVLVAIIVSLAVLSWYRPKGADTPCGPHCD